MIDTRDSQTTELRLILRVVMLLEASRNAGISPVPAEALHNLAYFANLLAPIWKLQPQDGKVLRLKRGPYYPDLQRQIDRLVAMGVIELSNLRYSQINQSEQWQILADYKLNVEKGRPILNSFSTWEEEIETFSFINELTLSLSALSDDQLKIADSQDATYSNMNNGFGNVIDFGEWKTENPSVNAAEHFQIVMPENLYLSKSVKLNLFIKNLDFRVQRSQTA